MISKKPISDGDQSDTIRAATIENRIAQFMEIIRGGDLLPYVEETNPPTIPDDLLFVLAEDAVLPTRSSQNTMGICHSLLIVPVLKVAGAHCGYNVRLTPCENISGRG